MGAGLGVALAPACVRTVGSPEVACVDLEGARVRSEVAFVRRAGDERPMLAAFGRLAVAVGGA